MCWVGADRAVNEATTLGLNAIYTPWGPYYINRTQGANEPPGAGYGVDDVRRTYTTVPFSTAAPGSDSLLRGVQGTFWTEHVSDPEYLEYLALPRLLAIAEAGWTPAELKSRPTSSDASLPMQSCLISVDMPIPASSCYPRQARRSTPTTKALRPSKSVTSPAGQA